MKYQRDLARDVIAILGDLVHAHRHAEPEPCDLPHLGYERWVAAPTRAGRNPAYDALMAQALAEAETNRKAAS